MSTVNCGEEPDAKLNQLDQLKKFTSIVADTADFESIRQFKPQDATTNPSLLYAATQKEDYSHFDEEVLANRRKSGLSGAAQIDDIIERLLVQFACDGGFNATSNRDFATETSRRRTEHSAWPGLSHPPSLSSSVTPVSCC